MHMAAIVSNILAPASAASRSRGGSLVVRVVLISLALLVLLLFLALPLVVVFVEALRAGVHAYWSAITNSDTLASIRLTILTASIAVPLNVVFGIAAAWCIAKFQFRGKSFLLALIDLPFAVSPVVAGLIFVLLFGRRGWLGAYINTPLSPSINFWFIHYTFHFTIPKIIFATPGIVLATLFVTFPFVARELIPLMQAQGTDEEQAARVLGASGWQIFWRVTLPNIKWGLLYGVILCNARAMGEFGAVYVVSGSIRGETATMPLQVEILYSDDFQAAFAVASLMAMLAIVTLVIKEIVGRKTARELVSS
jgi:sulfate transport system permease protein